MSNYKLYKRKWNRENKDKIHRSYERRKEYYRNYYALHKDELGKTCRDQCREAHTKRKLVLIRHYSNGTMSCSQCGYSDIRALCIDHINNNGAEEKRIHGGSSRVWAHIIKQGFPKGYQVLCCNCNQIKEMERRKNNRL